MRIKYLRIENYKGLRFVETPDTSSLETVTISGKNGTGKSLLLELVVAVWRGTLYSPEKLVGPWGSQFLIEIEMSLTESEWIVLDEWARVSGQIVDRSQGVRLKRWWNRTGIGGGEETSAIGILKSSAFQSAHAFATLGFLPAVRQVQVGQATSVNPGMLNFEQAQQDQINQINSYIQYRAPFQLGDVNSYLATLDYLDLIAGREGGEPLKEFDIISDAFYAATGKRLNRPVVNDDGGTSLLVEIADRQTHGIDGLSSGEQGALGMMYFLRRLNSSKGILFLDEPELHLHPSLQAALFQIIAPLSDEAQIWVVSHSPAIISNAPSEGIFQMHPARADGRNQVATLAPNSGTSELLQELGISASSLVQYDFLLAVEGISDESWLRKFLPVELGRVFVYNTGGASQLMAALRTLKGTDQKVPWLCIRDRDFLDDAEVKDLDDPNLLVWSRRAIENLFLEPRLLAEAFERAGRATTEVALSDELFEIANRQKAEVQRELVKKRLLAQFQRVAADHEISEIEKFRFYLKETARLSESRAAALDEAHGEVEREINKRWPNEWQKLVQGKSVIGALLPGSPFKDLETLVNVLSVICREDSTMTPPDIAQLQARLSTAMNNEDNGSLK